MNTQKFHETWDSENQGGELKSWKACEYIDKSHRWKRNKYFKEDFCLWGRRVE